MFAPEIVAQLKSKNIELPQLLMAPSLRHDYDDIMAMLTPPCPVAIIDDNDTATAMGDALCRALRSRYAVTRIACGKAPVADAKTVNSIRRKSKSAQLLIAVGSGTVSDLCKYASYLDNKPYIVFPTAASMNGYLSANASITIDGYKTTLPAHLPKAVFCDLSVITAAPARLNKSGLGDSLARPSAQADWLLSHLLLGTPYDETPYSFTQNIEPELFDHARGLALADPSSVQLLMQVLLLSGLGMTHAGGSYPASQSEHMLAHAYEMLAPHATATLHGEQIGVTTLTTVARQERLIARPPSIPALTFPHDAIEKHFGSHVTQNAQTATQEKNEKMEAAGLTESALKARWPDIAHRLQTVMLPSAHINDILTQAQAPRIPEALGWNANDYAIANSYARYLRDRFTCLDLIPV